MVSSGNIHSHFPTLEAKSRYHLISRSIHIGLTDGRNTKLPSRLRNRARIRGFLSSRVVYRVCHRGRLIFWSSSLMFRGLTRHSGHQLRAYTSMSSVSTRLHVYATAYGRSSQHCSRSAEYLRVDAMLPTESRSVQ